MGDRNMKYSLVDPVASVLLDFQSVMAQFLELQTDVLAAHASRSSRARDISPVAVAQDDRDIVENTVANIAEAPAVPAAEPHVMAPVREQPHIAIEQAPFSRYTLSVRERPLSSVRAGLAAGHAVVLTDDGRGIARLVAEKLRADGRRVAILSNRGDSDPLGDLFVSTLDSSDEAARVAAAIVQSCGPVAAVIHLAPLSAAPGFDTLDAESWWARLSVETRMLFLLAKSFGESLELAARNGGSALLAATSMGGAFGIASADRPLLPSQGGVAGFMKCVAIEWPDVRVRAIDTDSAESVESIAAHVVDELWAADARVEIGYLNRRRVGIEPVRTPASLNHTFDLPSDAVILATGGGRGITAEVCLELAERYQPTFVLVGQSPLPAVTESTDTASLTAPADIKRALIAQLNGVSARVTPVVVEKAFRQLMKEREVRDVISRLSAAGARTHYVQLDVTDERAFGALLDEIYVTYGRLDGVIHGAGIIEDKLVRDKSLESFDRVLRTKAVSAFVLSRHLRPDTLRFLIFFSSVAGRFGNRGQSDYAAANEVVSKLAIVLQRQWPIHVCAIAWAPWDKLGMVSPELKREFARRGVELLSPAAGRRALWQEIQQSPAAAAEVVVGGYAATPIAGEAQSEPLPLLKHSSRETSSDGTVRFVRTFDPSADVFLNDHRLDGKAVLPLAFATELMAEAAQAVWPDLRVVAVRDLQLLKGIVVDRAPLSATVTVRSAVHSTDNGMTEVDVDISTPSVMPPARYRSVVQMASRRAEAPAFDAPAWALAPLEKSLDRAYEEWTFHGPLFQRITDISGIGIDSMLGTVYSPSVTTALAHVGRPEWIIDPFVFDAALQLLLMWSRAQNDKTALPSRFHSFTRYAPLSDQKLTCYVAVESLAGGHALRSNVHFVNPEGRVLAVLDTMEANCTSALNRVAGADTRVLNSQ
jgi:NAD(P)-dependent dehydrogenase (short-subunit alcohol dehydrogenase family)